MDRAHREATALLACLGLGRTYQAGQLGSGEQGSRGQAGWRHKPSRAQLGLAAQAPYSWERCVALGWAQVAGLDPAAHTC